MKAIVAMVTTMAIMLSLTLTSGCGTIFGAGVGSGATYWIMQHKARKLAAENAATQSNLEVQVTLLQNQDAEKQRQLVIATSMAEDARKQLEMASRANENSVSRVSAQYESPRHTFPTREVVPAFNSVGNGDMVLKMWTGRPAVIHELRASGYENVDMK